MLRRVLLTLVVLGIGVAVPLAANASGGKTVSIPLPAPNAASIVSGKVTIDGKGPVRVHTANDSALGNLALIYAIGKPKKTGATSTWTVIVFIKRFLSERRSAGTGGGTVELAIDRPSGTKVFTVSRSFLPLDCSALQALDKAFEGGGAASLNGATITLQNGRTPSEQPSPPEEVMDNVIASANGCPGFKPEGDDPGNK